MQALDIRDNSLQWETERQNRIHQEALELRKKQARADDTRKEFQFIEKVSQDLAGSRDYVSGAARLTAESGDKVRRIPDMRSAWIPLDEAEDGSDWSMPFSLPKADMEPWLSFFKGYKESRLFLETSPAHRNQAAEEKNEQQIDFAVRALLELKQIGAKVILEPPVQINGLVEYLDLSGELRACSDPMLAKSLVKVANDSHASQLGKAVAKGREMGNLLHEALMGDGHVNLIKAWERVHGRKPTIDELHLMLTTGRVKVSAERKPQALAARAAPEPSPQRAAAVNKASRPVPQKQSEVAVIREKLRQQEAAAAEAEKVEAALASIAKRQPQHGGNQRKILLHLLHAVVCCAALVAYGVAYG